MGFNLTFCLNFIIWKNIFHASFSLCLFRWQLWASVQRDLNSHQGFPWTPFQCLSAGRDVCGFPTGMRRPDPCTTHYTPHTLHHTMYSIQYMVSFHHMPHMTLLIWAKYLHCSIKEHTLIITYWSWQSIPSVEYAIFCIYYTYTMYTIHTEGWSEHSGSNVERRRRRDQQGGQVVEKLVLSCCPGTNTLHYRDKYATVQRQIRQSTVTNTLHYRDKYTTSERKTATHYYIGWGHHPLLNYKRWRCLPVGSLNLQTNASLLSHTLQFFLSMVISVARGEKPVSYHTDLNYLISSSSSWSKYRWRMRSKLCSCHSGPHSRYVTSACGARIFCVGRNLKTPQQNPILLFSWQQIDTVWSTDIFPAAWYKINYQHDCDQSSSLNLVWMI